MLQFMVFGENEDPYCYTFYQIMDFDGEFDRSKTDEIVTKLLAKGNG